MPKEQVNDDMNIGSDGLDKRIVKVIDGEVFRLQVASFEIRAKGIQRGMSHSITRMLGSTARQMVDKRKNATLFIEERRPHE